MTKELSYVILEPHNVRMKPSNVRKSEGITKYEKRTVTCDVGIAQCEDETVKCKETTQCDKITVRCDIGTAQYEDGTVKCEKKVREPSNVIKKLSYVILEPHNIRIELSNMRKKSKRTTKCEKKLSHVMLELHNVRMKPTNVRKK